MTSQPRKTAEPSLPTAFVEAFDGLLAGAISLDFARRALASAVEHDFACSGAIKALIEEAYEDTRLSDEDFEALNHELVHRSSEDVPTDWSEAAAARTQTIRLRASPDQQAAPDAPNAQPLYPGAVLRGRFVLQARTAAGSMGEIYKALDRRKQELGVAEPFVAIKVISPGFNRFAEAVRVLQHEAALGQRLAHPNIARVLDFDRDGEHAFVTLEWLEGESLGELLTRLRYRPVATARARQVLEEIGAALSHAHQAGIVHGDVKPGNIFLTSTGVAKLLDFGAGRSVDSPSDTLTGKTPPYASCEVLEGATATAQDDLYSLACVAYRMLAGRRAFDRLSAAEAERSGMQPTRIAHLTDAQWRALSHALAFRRSGRPASVEDFLREFGAHAFPANAVPPAHVLPPVIVRIAPRQRLVASAAALVACGVVLAMLLRPPSDAPLQAAAPPQSPAATTLAAAGPLPAEAAAADATPSGQIAQTSASASRRTADATQPMGRAPARAGVADTVPSRAQAAETALANPATAATSKPPRSRAKDNPAETRAPVAATTATTMPGAPTDRSPSGESAARLPSPNVAPSASGQPALLPPTPEQPAGNDATGQTGPPFVPLGSLRFTKFVEPTERYGLIARSNTPGWVLVTFRVDTAGRTSGIEVLEAEPKGRYESEAISAVRRWRFEPFMEDGKPVERQTRVRIRFERK